jgi:hypothetical protein
MAKYYIIYETKNLKDGKIYIGMHETNNLEDGYLGSGKRLKRAIRYYGKEFFERKILFTFNNCEDMIAKEIELVNEDFIKRKDTYNIALGGKGGTITEELKQKWIKSGIKGNETLKRRLKEDINLLNRFREFNKNRARVGSKNSSKFKGKTHSEETKEKMRNSQSGKQSGSRNSQFGKCWITNGKENKKILKDDLIPKGWRLGRKINIHS